MQQFSRYNSGHSGTSSPLSGVRPMLRSWLLFHFASGQAFFSGSALLIAAVLLSPWAVSRPRRRLRNACVLFGVILVVCSATPLPVWGYAALTLVSIVWLALEYLESRRDRRPSNPGTELKETGAGVDESEPPDPLGRRWTPLNAARGLAAAAWMGAVVVEIPWHVTPRLPPVDRPVLAVIADSVTAGMGENEAVTWPQRLAKEHGIPVHDYSRMGATVKSARRQAARLTPEDNLVLLEIGGNDLLGSSTARHFEAGLDQLLLDIGRPERTVVMFELPLPPTFNAYGGIQRRLAKRHGVILIPKRLLMRVLCRSDTTLDSIHLSQAGHDELAAAVWSVVREAYPPAGAQRHSTSPRALPVKSLELRIAIPAPIERTATGHPRARVRASLTGSARDAEMPPCCSCGQRSVGEAP